MVSVCFRLLQIINLKIFHIGAFSDWLQTGFMLVPDCHEEFQIMSSDFRLLQIAFRLLSNSFQTGLKNCKNFRFCLHILYCFRLSRASTEEENAAAAAAGEEAEELRRTDLERRMEAAADDLERRVEAVAEAAPRGGRRRPPKKPRSKPLPPNMPLKPPYMSRTLVHRLPILPHLPPRPRS